MDDLKRPVTVEMLIQLLSALPPKALVWESTHCSDAPMDRSDLYPACGPLMVYEKDGEVRLYIDDGEAFHGDAVENYRSNLFMSGGAWDRIKPGLDNLV